MRVFSSSRGILKLIRSVIRENSEIHIFGKFAFSNESLIERLVLSSSDSQNHRFYSKHPGSPVFKTYCLSKPSFLIETLLQAEEHRALPCNAISLRRTSGSLSIMDTSTYVLIVFYALNVSESIWDVTNSSILSWSNRIIYWMNLSRAIANFERFISKQASIEFVGKLTSLATAEESIAEE